MRVAEKLEVLRLYYKGNIVYIPRGDCFTYEIPVNSLTLLELTESMGVEPECSGKRLVFDEVIDGEKKEAPNSHTT